MVEGNTDKKVCTKCGKELDKKYFSYRTDTNKLRDQCKKCHKGYKTDNFDKQANDLALFNKGKKYCGKCGKIKPLIDFNHDKSTRFGYTSRCRACLHEISTSEHNLFRDRRNRIKNRYNGTDEDVDRIFNTHSCEICGVVFSTKTHKHVDHDHATGKIRGCLCNKCNMGLGSFNDDILKIRKSILYLKKYANDDNNSK